MEYAMTYPHCVVLERSVYMGGGDTDWGGDEYYIQEYNMKTIFFRVNVASIPGSHAP